MEKSCHSSGQEESSPITTSTTTTTTTSTNTTNNNKDNFLKQIHKFSHKISKPPLNHHHNQNIHHQVQHLPLILDQDTRNESQPSDLSLHQNPQQHQPPVYNVSKSDFRDVVQKLTGSPAHERPVQPVPPVKPQSSRLQRIRPPPLEQIGNRPPPSSLNPNFRPVNGSFFPGQRPLSPLPPLPAVHATAESPISAYMRCFQTNVTGFNPPPPPQLHQRPAAPDFPAPSSPLPSSPLPFGCLNSPKSQFPMLSPGFPFGFQQLTPLSPTPPAPSPRWKAV